MNQQKTQKREKKSYLGWQDFLNKLKVNSFNQMNEKDIQKIYAIFFVAPLVMFLQTNFTTIIKSFDNGHKKRRRFSSNFNSSVLPSQ